MSIELKVPTLGESISEVEIGDWLKAEGASVGKDENIVALESDKATVEVPSPVAGKITKILKRKGQTAAIGEVIAHIDQIDAPAEAAPAPVKTAPAKANGNRAASPAPKAEAAQPTVETEKPAARPEPVRKESKTVESAPVVSRDPSPKEQPAPEQNLTPADNSQAAKAGSDGKLAGSREEEIVPMTPLRRAVAKHLVEAQQTAALLTTINEVDMTAVMALRKEYQPAFTEKYGVKLGIMSFFVKACVDALKLIPQVNSEVRGTNVIYRNYFDIGIAVGSGKGLVVPILRNAEQLSFSEIELAISNFGQRAKENKLKPSELQGGTFTISNGGVYGSLLSTPIVNAPQSGILGLHTIQDRPVARNGNVVICSMMYIALTYDHRVVDGREGVTFLKRIKDAVEAPTRMLLEV